MDDEPDPLHAMAPILAQPYPQFNAVTFDNVPDINDWFADNLLSCVLICLNHDLNPNRMGDGAVFDSGIGHDFVDYILGFGGSELRA